MTSLFKRLFRHRERKGPEEEVRSKDPIDLTECSKVVPNITSNTKRRNMATLLERWFRRRGKKNSAKKANPNLEDLEAYFSKVYYIKPELSKNFLEELKIPLSSEEDALPSPSAILPCQTLLTKPESASVSFIPNAVGTVFETITPIGQLSNDAGSIHLQTPAPMENPTNEQIDSTCLNKLTRTSACNPATTSCQEPLKRSAVCMVLSHKTTSLPPLQLTVEQNLLTDVELVEQRVVAPVKKSVLVCLKNSAEPVRVENVLPAIPLTSNPGTSNIESIVNSRVVAPVEKLVKFCLKNSAEPVRVENVPPAIPLTSNLGTSNIECIANPRVVAPVKKSVRFYLKNSDEPVHAENVPPAVPVVLNPGTSNIESVVTPREIKRSLLKNFNPCGTKSKCAKESDDQPRESISVLIPVPPTSRIWVCRNRQILRNEDEVPIDGTIKDTEVEREKKCSWHNPKISLLFRDKVKLPTPITVKEDVQRHYKHIRELGKGTFGTVSKVKDRNSKGKFALKVIKTELGYAGLVLNEIAILKELKGHPRLLSYFSHYIHTEDPDHIEFGILMEVFRGKNINQYKREKPLRQKDVKMILYQLGKALAYVHEREIIHCDIKPENILVNDKMEMKLIDFGLACKGPVSITTCGTRGFSAPEVGNFKEGYGPSRFGYTADYYSVGASFHDILYGVEPPEKTAFLHVMTIVIQFSFDYITPRRSNNYADLITKNDVVFMAKLLNYSPEARPNDETYLKDKYFDSINHKK